MVEIDKEHSCVRCAYCRKVEQTKHVCVLNDGMRVNERIICEEFKAQEGFRWKRFRDHEPEDGEVVIRASYYANEQIFDKMSYFLQKWSKTRDIENLRRWEKEHPENKFYFCSYTKEGDDVYKTWTRLSDAKPDLHRDVVFSLVKEDAFNKMVYAVEVFVKFDLTAEMLLSFDKDWNGYTYHWAYFNGPEDK